MISYAAAAQSFKPARINILFLVEAPSPFNSPFQQSHFYFTDNPRGDLLFGTLIKAVLDVEYNKAAGRKMALLNDFKARGYFFMEAVEEPIAYVNGEKTDERQRTEFLAKAVPGLLARLAALKAEGCLPPETGIILLKKLVYRVLAPVLTEKGYRVLNKEEIGFPRRPYDPEMVVAIRKLLPV